MAFATWIEVTIGTMIIIIKVIYKIIPYVILQFSFDGDHRKIDVSNRKGIPQAWKTMEIRVPVRVAGVKIMFEFIMSTEDLVCP